MFWVNRRVSSSSRQLFGEIRTNEAQQQDTSWLPLSLMELQVSVTHCMSLMLSGRRQRQVRCDAQVGVTAAAGEGPRASRSFSRETLGSCYKWFSARQRSTSFSVHLGEEEEEEQESHAGSVSR